jgi:hypothetical protein
MFEKFLMHDRLLVRFGSLLGVIMIVFLGVWIIGYIFLPEGVLLGKTATQALAGNDLAGGSIYLEWLRIFSLNLGMIGLFVAANLLRASGNVPLGYVAVAVNTLMFGVIIGTNSFTISQGAKIPPSFGIFGSTGLYKIVAYVLAVAATGSISKYRLIGKWGEKMSLPQLPSMIRERNVGVSLAIVILALACGWEAYRVSLAITS